MRASVRAQRLAAARLYVCTPVRADIEAFADTVFSAGVDILQLRDKNASAEALIEAGAAVRRAADRHSALFAINDRADIALVTGADVLHLGQDDLPLRWARRVVGDTVLLGRSTHGIEQVRLALDEKWDYIAVGPVYATPTKPGRPATGLRLLADVSTMNFPTPWFAIGGVDNNTAPEVIGAGARRLVVVRAIVGASEPASATRALRSHLEEDRHPV